MHIDYHKNSSGTDSLFSIIIPSWNNLEYLKICVDSIHKNSSFRHQVILHINEGVDGTLEWTKEQGLDYTYSKENAGICFACNAAASLATTDYILYMNDDMYACPQWDLYLKEEIDRCDSIYFYLSATMIEHRDTGNDCVLAPYLFGDTPANFKEEELLRQLPELMTKKGDWSGSMWPPSVMHRRMWELIGGFSVEFSPGLYSDPDICMKLWEGGCRHFKGVGKSLVYHFMSKSTGKARKLNPGKLQFQKKWGIRPKFLKRHYLQLGALYKGPLTGPTEDQIKKENFTVKWKNLIS